jgi:hypothetical protein
VLLSNDNSSTFMIFERSLKGYPQTIFGLIKNREQFVSPAPGTDAGLIPAR